MLIIHLICLIFLLILPFSFQICEKTIINLTQNKRNLSDSISSLFKTNYSNLSCNTDLNNLPTINKNDKPLNLIVNEKYYINLMKHHQDHKIVSTFLGNILDNNTILTNNSVLISEEYFNSSTNDLQYDKENKKVIAKFPKGNLSLHDTFYFFTIKDDFLIGLGLSILGYTKDNKGIRVYNVMNNYLHLEKEILKEVFPQRVFIYHNDETKSYFLLVKSVDYYSIYEVRQNNAFTEETDTIITIQNKTIINNKIVNYIFFKGFHYLCFKNLGIQIFDKNGLLVNSLSNLIENNNSNEIVQIKKAILQGDKLYLLIRFYGIVICQMNQNSIINKCNSVFNHPYIGGVEVALNYIHLFFEGNEDNDEFYFKTGYEESNLKGTKLLLLRQNGISLKSSIMLDKFIILNDKFTNSLVVISTDNFSTEKDIIFSIPFYETSIGRFKFKETFKLNDIENNPIVGVRLENDAIVFISKIDIDHNKLEIEFNSEGKFEVILIYEYIDQTEGRIKRIQSKNMIEVKKLESNYYINIETLFVLIFIIITVIVIGRRIYHYSQVIDIQKNVTNGYTPTATSDRNNFVYDNNSI
jgi:hypothetical protein